MKLLSTVLFLTCCLLVWFILYQNNILMPIPEEKVVLTQPKDTFTNARIKQIYKEQATNLPAHDLVCIPEKKFICSLNGCTENEPDIFNLVKMSKSSEDVFLLRCDSKPCDSYEVRIVPSSGDMFSLDTLDYKGLLFRSSLSNQDYTEIVTLGTTSFISNGYCYAAK